MFFRKYSTQISLKIISTFLLHSFARRPTQKRTLVFLLAQFVVSHSISLVVHFLNITVFQSTFRHSLCICPYAWTSDQNTLFIFCLGWKHKLFPTLPKVPCPPKICILAEKTAFNVLGSSDRTSSFWDNYFYHTATSKENHKHSVFDRARLLGHGRIIILFKHPYATLRFCQHIIIVEPGFFSRHNRKNLTGSRDLNFKNILSRTLHDSLSARQLAYAVQKVYTLYEGANVPVKFYSRSMPISSKSPQFLYRWFDDFL